jgi:CheY-like chemotaxis protein
MPRTPVILAVSHNPRNLDLLGHVLGSAGYQLSPARSLEAFDRAVAHAEAIRLALVDIAGFDARMWERCERLRVHGIPFLVLSPY